jgi:SSS family solute:Na+ symporter
MSPTLILACIFIYFLCLIAIGFFTSRKADENAYFIGNKQSVWYIVAFGLIGDSLSGLTYLSVPGSVKTAQFNYFQIVLGYVLGYWAIAYFLLPLYYKQNLTSIYSYLQNRIGTISQRTGSFYFILSRLIGAGGRLFLGSNGIAKICF